MKNITMQANQSYGECEKKIGQSLNSDSGRVTVLCSAQIERELKAFISGPGKAVLGVSYTNPYTQKKEKFPDVAEEFELRHFQMLARNEKSNVTGKIEVKHYQSLLSEAQIATLRVLVAKTTVVGPVAVQFTGGYPRSVEQKKVNDPYEILVIDQSGHQFQDSLYSNAAVFFYPDKDQNLPEGYVAWQEETYHQIFGVERPEKPSSKVLEIDRLSGEDANPIDDGFMGIKGSIDLDQFTRLGFATEYDSFLRSAAYASLDQDEPVLARFLRAGLGFFMFNACLEHEQAQKIELARLDGILIVLKDLSKQTPEERKKILGNIASFDFPFSEGQQGQKTYKKCQEIKALVEGMGYKYGGAGAIDALTKPQDHKLATNNCGDPHAFLGNEGSLQSVDAMFASNCTGVGAFHATANPSMQSITITMANHHHPWKAKQQEVERALQDPSSVLYQRSGMTNENLNVPVGKIFGEIFAYHAEIANENYPCSVNFSADGTTIQLHVKPANQAKVHAMLKKYRLDSKGIENSPHPLGEDNSLMYEFSVEKVPELMEKMGLMDARAANSPLLQVWMPLHRKIEDPNVEHGLPKNSGWNAVIVPLIKKRQAQQEARQKNQPAASIEEDPLRLNAGQVKKFLLGQGNTSFVMNEGVAKAKEDPAEVAKVGSIFGAVLGFHAGIEGDYPCGINFSSDGKTIQIHAKEQDQDKVSAIFKHCGHDGEPKLSSHPLCVDQNKMYEISVTQLPSIMERLGMTHMTLNGRKTNLLLQWDPQHHKNGSQPSSVRSEMQQAIISHLKSKNQLTAFELEIKDPSTVQNPKQTGNLIVRVWDLAIKKIQGVVKKIQEVVLKIKLKFVQMFDSPKATTGQSGQNEDPQAKKNEHQKPKDALFSDAKERNFEKRFSAQRIKNRNVDSKDTGRF
jgi:hypothetical protein